MTLQEMDHLDNQMKQWSSRLRDDLKIMPPESNRLASTIASEVASLSPEAKQRIKDASLVPLPVRIEELQAFQGWMDLVHNSNPHPVVARAQIIAQNYIWFVYLGEACFTILRKELPAGSATKKCCKFLTDNPVRAFRNAIAHSNWRYLPDFTGIGFWAKKGPDAAKEVTCPHCGKELTGYWTKTPEHPEQFTVLQQDLSFWQAVARCTGYASYLSL